MSETTERPAVQDRYYHESTTEDGELVTFEAGAWVGEGREDHHYAAGEALASCEMPRRREAFDRQVPCENPAIALIRWAGGGASKVCREHYDDIRSDFKASAEVSDGD